MREKISILSEKTRAEQSAGRKALGLEPEQQIMLDAIHHEIVSKAMAPLRKRFPTIMSATAFLEYDLDAPPATYRVGFQVQCPNGEFVDLTGNFSGFPDDELIATLMLLVG